MTFEEEENKGEGQSDQLMTADCVVIYMIFISVKPWSYQLLRYVLGHCHRHHHHRHLTLPYPSLGPPTLDILGKTHEATVGIRSRWALSSLTLDCFDCRLYVRWA